MSPNPRPTSQVSRSRAKPLVAILLLTLGLAGVLTYEAWDAARKHQIAAEETLREYAAFAAWEFNAAVKDQFYSTLVWFFAPVAHTEPLWPKEKPAPPGILIAGFKAEYRCDPAVAPALFRVDLPHGGLVEHENSLDDAFAHWVRDTITAEIAAGRYGADYLYQAVFGTVGGARRNIIYQVKWDPQHRPVAAYGFEFCLRRFAPPSIQKVLLKGMVLPPSVTKGLPNDSIFSVVVRDGLGADLFRSPALYESPFKNTHTLEYLGGLQTEVTFRPDVAERLLIGGVPSSRLPLLLGVLATTLVLVIFGLLDLRREDELQRLRSDFVASVSHELRTPLAQLRMFAETLLLGRVRSDQERTRSLEIIDQEARRLSHLVENILQFSRAEREALQLNLVSQDLAPHVQEAVEIFGPIARARRVAVDADLAVGLRARIDAGAMRQILLNLLDNAVKYGPTDQKVRLTLSREGSQARLTVDDQGPGIPAGDRVRIWQAFQRLQRDVNSAVAGSGIGLAVVCELILSQGGKAWVEEAPGGRGARFVVELPLDNGGEAHS